MRLLGSFFIFLFIVSCSTLTKRDLTWSENEKILTIYVQAIELEKTNPLQACERYRQVAGEVGFVLGDLALLKSHLYCSDKTTLKPISPLIMENQPWLSTTYLQWRQQEAEAKNDLKELVVIFLEKSKQNLRSQEKLELIDKALEYANLAQDQQLISQVQERKQKLFPRFIPQPLPSEYLRVGQDHLLNRNFDKARFYFRKIIGGQQFSIDEKYQAYRIYRNSFKTEQKKLDHIDAAERMAKWLHQTKAYHRQMEAYLTLARAQWTEGQVQLATKTLKRAERHLRRKYSLAEIYWIYGRMSEERRDFQKALLNYQIAENELSNDPELREKILSHKAWVLQKLQRYTEAAKHFAELQRDFSEKANRNKYLFWEAMNWQRAGQTETAKGLLLQLRQQDPLGFYGLLTYYQLQDPIPPLAISPNESVLPSPAYMLDHHTQLMVRSLAIVGDKELLEKFLQFKLPNYRTSVSDKNTLLFILKNQAATGSYQPLFNYLSQLAPEERLQVVQENPSALFPRKYLEHILPTAKKFEVDAEFILSIIRQESAFDTFARSHADAFGLMQLLPSVAKEHDRHTDQKLQSYEDLYLPEKNIPYGTSLIAQLKRKYRGQFILVAAAYNANERAIAGWLKTRFQDDTLEFIEDIPYEETRTYVKLVMRNYIFYQRILRMGEAIPFPRQFLENAESLRELASLSN